MASQLGNTFKVSVFGESHGKAVGVVMDGLPAGEQIEEAELLRFLARRKPGQNRMTTPRQEDDLPKFLSGMNEGYTNGFPVCAIIENRNQHSKDYNNLFDNPRPGHADYTAYLKYGEHRDMRGGGHFSARLTAPLCIAGGIALQILERRGIYIGAHLLQVGNAKDEAFPMYPDKALFDEAAKRSPATLSDEAADAMKQEILAAKADDDSVGGMIECAIVGLPAGLGAPMFDGMENRLASALFGIPAVKGVSFGKGFEVASMRGSENNDPFRMEDGKVVCSTNNAGGILGGITNGMPLTFRIAIKPTSSIEKEQDTVNLPTGTNTKLTVRGRHDPCVAVRAVPVAEAVAAIVILDLLLEEGKI